MNKLLILLFCFLSTITYSQNTDQSAPLLVRFQEGVNGKAFIQQFQTSSRSGTDLQIERRVSKLLNIYKLKSTTSLANKNALESLKKRREVLSIGYDEPATYRNITPNDNLYEDQWNLEKINLPEVWSETRGGSTAKGDDIVVAILEMGITLDHPDIADNIWTNAGEIPDDGIDNDGNGYIDDFLGLNLNDLTDNHPLRNHGTEVAGVIGARTDNNIGMAGVNWNVKMLFLSEVDFTSDVIEAYEYLYNLRKKYNETNGREGALIVANNNSFGWNTRPENLQFGVELCEMYNFMGSVGILSVGAGPNEDVDVEIVGDVPTNCTSRFFIGVTSTDRDDNKRGGFGATSIDIGAPGEDIPATSEADDYCRCSGTSFAAPHVAGAIGLMYSVQCLQLADDAINNASGTARFMRDILLAGVDPASSLEGITVTGGRLNVLQAINNLQVYCGTNQSNRLAIGNVYPSPVDTELSVEYVTPDFEPYIFSISNALGQVVSTRVITPPRFSEPVETENVSGLSAGVYFVSFQREDKIVAKRFIVR